MMSATPLVLALRLVVPAACWAFFLSAVSVPSALCRLLGVISPGSILQVAGDVVNLDVISVANFFPRRDWPDERERYKLVNRCLLPSLVPAQGHLKVTARGLRLDKHAQMSDAPDSSPVRDFITSFVSGDSEPCLISLGLFGKSSSAAPPSLMMPIAHAVRLYWPQATRNQAGAIAHG